MGTDDRIIALLLTLGLAACGAGAPEADAAPGVDRDDGEESAAFPIVDATHSQLFGASAGRTWMPAHSVATGSIGGESYKLYNLTALLGESEGSAVGPPDEICENQTVRMLRVPDGEGDVVAVGGAWDALPRVPRLLDTASSVYVQAAADRLRERGMGEADIRLTQVITIDLEGDGDEEVLVSGNLQRGLGTSALPGDYGFTVLWRDGQGGFAATPLEEEYFPDGCVAECAPRAFQVAAVLDLNGNGQMEVVLAYRDYEGGGKTIYEVDGDEVNAVLSWRCGA